MNDDPSPEDQIAMFRAEHRELDARICAMVESGVADQLELARLKRRKLRLKDEIQLLLDRTIPDIIA